VSESAHPERPHFRRVIAVTPGFGGCASWNQPLACVTGNLKACGCPHLRLSRRVCPANLLFQSSSKSRAARRQRSEHSPAPPPCRTRMTIARFPNKPALATSRSVWRSI